MYSPGAQTETSISHLARIRRFARNLAGGTKHGDDLVRRALGQRAALLVQRDLDHDFLLDMFKRVLDKAVQSGDRPREQAVGKSNLQDRALFDLGLVSVEFRAAFVATFVESFSFNDQARIFDTHTDATHSVADLADPEIRSFERLILIINDDEDLAQIVAMYLRREDHDPMIATSVDGARALLQYRAVDLAIVNPVFDGFDFQMELAGESEDQSTEVMWYITDPGYAAVLDGDRPEPILTPEQHGPDLVEAIQDALYVQPLRWVDPDSSFDFDAHLLPIGDETDKSLAPLLAPIDAEVVGGRLVIAPSDLPEAAVSLDGLDAIREQHLQEAQWQANSFRQGNGEPRVQRHLDALVALLAQALTDQGVLRLTVGVDGMARQLSTIEAEMMPLAASDIASLITGLQQFINQFPISRQFRAEAAAGRPITPAEEEALREIAAVIVAQPAEVVEPALTEQLALQERARAQQAGSAVGDVARVSSLSNIVKAPAREIARFGKDLGKEIRKLAVEGIATLVVGLTGASALHFLAVAFPEQFAAVYILLTRAKKQMDDAGLGGGEEKD